MMIKHFLFLIFTAILSPHLAFAVAGSHPSPVYTGDLEAGDVFKDCIASNNPSIVYDINTNKPYTDIERSTKHKGCYDFNQIQWYGLENHLKGNAKIRYSTVDSKSITALEYYGLTRDTWGNILPTPGRLCLKYFGVPGDANDYAVRYHIWYGYCKDFAVGFDDQGIVSVGRYRLPRRTAEDRYGAYKAEISESKKQELREIGISEENLTRYRVPEIDRGYEPSPSRVFFKRTGGDNFYSTRYQAVAHACSIVDITNGACKYTTASWYKQYYKFGSIDSPWYAISSTVKWKANEISTIASDKKEAAGAQLLSNKDPKVSTGGYSFCTLRVPPGYHYPVANHRNTMRYDKLGRNYNLKANEEYYHNTRYINGERSEICAYMSLGAGTSCSTPFKGLYNADFADSGGLMNDTAYLIVGGFIGCVTEPLPPPPPIFNAIITSKVAPTLLNTVEGTFFEPVVTVTNGMNNQDALVPTVTSPMYTEIKLTAFYKTDDSDIPLSNCQSLPTGTLTGKRFFSNKKTDKICAVIPYDSPSEICVCYRDKCNIDEYISCTPEYSRPSLNGNFHIERISDIEYGEGLQVLLPKAESLKNNPNNITFPNDYRQNNAHYQNTVFEVVYQQQFMDLQNIRNNVISPSEVINVNNTEYQNNRRKLTGFVYDQPDMQLFSGIRLSAAIPLQLLDTDNKYYSRLVKMFTPAAKSNTSGSLINGGGNCLNYKIAPDSHIYSSDAQYSWFIHPGGRRVRVSQPTKGLNGIEAGLSPELYIGTADNYTVYKTPDSYCRGLVGALEGERNCFIQLERNADTGALLNKDLNANMLCKHESAGVTVEDPTAFQALEIVQPGIYKGSLNTTEDKLCLFTNDPVSYYLLTGVVDEGSKNDAPNMPREVKCVPIPAEGCAEINTPSQESGYMTWGRLTQDESEQQVCPNVGIMNYNTNKGTYKVIAEPEKEYHITVSGCTGSCAEALKKAQMLLQQGYRKYCVDNRTLGFGDKPMLPLDTESYKSTYGILDEDDKYTPDCRIGVDPTLLAAAQAELAKIPTVATLEAIPIDKDTTTTLNLTGNFKPYLFDYIGGGQPDIMTFSNFIESSRLGRHYALLLSINNGGKYAEGIGGKYRSTITYNSGGLYYINFKACNGNLGGATCSASQMLKAQKYLYLFLMQKEDGRNLSIFEETAIRAALNARIDTNNFITTNPTSFRDTAFNMTRTFTSYCNEQGDPFCQNFPGIFKHNDDTYLLHELHGPTIRNAFDPTFGNYMYYLSGYDTKLNITTIRKFSETPIASNVLVLSVQNKAMIRTCTLNESSGRYEAKIQGTCKFTPNTDLCPALTNDYDIYVAGNANWQGVNYWNNTTANIYGENHNIITLQNNEWLWPRFNLHNILKGAGGSNPLNIDVSKLNNYLYFQQVGVNLGTGSNISNWQNIFASSISLNQNNVRSHAAFKQFRQQFILWNNQKNWSPSGLVWPVITTDWFIETPRLYISHPFRDDTYSNSAAYNSLKDSRESSIKSHFISLLDHLKRSNGVYETMFKVGYRDYMVEGTCKAGTSANNLYVKELNKTTVNPVRACRIYYIMQGHDYPNSAYSISDPNAAPLGHMSPLGSHWMPVKNPCQ